MNVNQEYFHETEAYTSEKERLKVAWELLSYANMIFRRVYVFEHFDAFSKSFRSDPPIEYWNGMQYEKLIDQIKICIAFENYNKAFLLSSGFMVHMIDSKKNGGLSKKQKSEPILIEEFLNGNKFIQNSPFTEWYLDGLNNFNTLPFGWTLSEGYQSIIKLDIRFLNYLKDVNQKRNRLHFYKNYHGAFRVETLLENLAFAKSYGTDLIVKELKRHDVLLKEFD